MSDSKDALEIIWNTMRWNTAQLVTEMCNADHLLYAVYGIWQQYSTDILARLDMIGITSATSAKGSIFQQFWVCQCV